MRRSAGAAIRDSGARLGRLLKKIYPFVETRTDGSVGSVSHTPNATTMRIRIDGQMWLEGEANRVLERRIGRVAGLRQQSRRPDEPLLEAADPASPCWPDSYEYLIDPFRLTRFPCIRRSFTLGKPLNEIWRYGEQQIGSHLQYAIGSARLVMDVVCVGMRMSRISELPRPPAQETVRVRKA